MLTAVWNEAGNPLFDLSGKRRIQREASHGVLCQKSPSVKTSDKKRRGGGFGGLPSRHRRTALQDKKDPGQKRVRNLLK